MAIGQFLCFMPPMERVGSILDRKSSLHLQFLFLMLIPPIQHSNCYYMDTIFSFSYQSLMIAIPLHAIEEILSIVTFYVFIMWESTTCRPNGIEGSIGRLEV